MTELEQDTNPEDIPTEQAVPQADENDQGELAEQHEGMPPVPDTQEEEAEDTAEAEGEEETKEGEES
jgi:hypothetical protein